MPSWKLYIYLVHPETRSQQLQVTQTGRQSKTLCQKLCICYSCINQRVQKRQKCEWLWGYISWGPALPLVVCVENSLSQAELSHHRHRIPMAVESPLKSLEHAPERVSMDLNIKCYTRFNP